MIALLLFVILLLLSLLTGTVSLSPSEVWQALTDAGADPAARFIVCESRLPQTLTAVLSGSALAAGGLVM